MSADSRTLRRYQAGVERALALFDATNEWADYIAFLSRLLKALQAAPTGADVPLKPTLARYLAQCLRPSLPAGVHQKALEVYATIFILLGKDGLSNDLSLYLPGISHTLSFASLSTRPWFLTLYNEHILKLSSSTLRPALKAIILSLLPGIEEENSEDFEKTLATMSRLRTTFAEDYEEHIFWQSLFLASITSPNRRLGILVYLSRYLPKLDQLSFSEGENKNSNTNGSHTSIQAVTSPEPGLLIRCFATGLQDEQPLVQRGFLDLLVTNLPLRAATLQRSGSANDLDILVASAVSIVLRRDMSLNRRLWAWFFGSEEKSSAPDHATPGGLGQQHENDATNDYISAHKLSSSPYFINFGVSSLVRTFKTMVGKKSSAPSQRARHFRILISLMDRAAIGGPVVEATFEAMIQDLKMYQTNAPSQEAFDEVFRSANVFFDSVEPRVIAHNLLALFEKRNFDLIEFISVNFSLEDDEMVHHHLPAIVFILSCHLLDQIEASSTTPEPLNLRSQVQLARLLNILLPIGSGTKPGSLQEASLTERLPAEVRDHIYHFYNINDSWPEPRPSLSTGFFWPNLCGIVSRLLIRCLWDPSKIEMLESLTSVFEKLCADPTNQQLLQKSGVIDEVCHWAKETSSKGSMSFRLSRNVAALAMAILAPAQNSFSGRSSNILSVIRPLVEDFWRRLSPSTPQHHVECVEAIWVLRSLSSDFYLVDSTIMSLLSEPSPYQTSQEHPIHHFAVLWVHTKLPNSSVTTSKGDEPESGSDAVTFFKMALLYIIDAVDMEKSSDPFRTWMSGLTSMNLLFQAALEGSRRGAESSHHVMTALCRVLKLTTIAKSSFLLWKEFVDPRGPVVPILERTVSIITSAAEGDENALISMDIIRLIHDGADGLFNDSLIELLSQQIFKTPNGGTLQSSILSTLQLLVTLNGAPPPLTSLLTTLMNGISSPDIDSNLDKWITLLCNAIPLYQDPVYFAHLLKLTECFCKRIQQDFEKLKLMYEDNGVFVPQPDARNPEKTITNLLSGLEYILARAHTKVTEAKRPSSSTQDNQVDVPQPRALANNRLTSVLCMQDAIKVCGHMWYWRSAKKTVAPSDAKSFNYMSSRLRSRTRRMLEHLIDAEPQECLETLMGMWVEAVKKTASPSFIMNLLESLDGARPKFMMPAIFNAIYGRTNPGALDADQKSSLSVDVTGLELVAFLIDYVDALEDDLLEEIWSDCTSFLRDILANPMPHRQILLRLLEFLGTLCQKMENTNFGDQVRMRRELADLCARLFTAIFTIKPGGFDQSSGRTSGRGERIVKSMLASVERFKSGNGIEILCHVLPSMSPVLSETDRITAIYSGVSTNITGPLLRARAFPTNVGGDVLDLLFIMSKAQSASKVWKKDILDAFNDAKFFQSLPAVADTGWVPIIKQLATLDKALIAEILARLTPPATAGIMFGVGASAARSEADKQAKANLKRIALLLVANDKDTYISSLSQIMIKVEELLTATPATSPSSGTRGEISLLLRAVSLRFSQNHLASLWPIIDSELRGIFEDMAKSPDSLFTPYSHIQAAKLLDVLLLVKPEEFQLHEWLYVTDTIDAIYPPATSKSLALADSLNLHASQQLELHSATEEGTRKPWLCTDISRNTVDQTTLLASFFSQLSIRAFEDIYSLDPVDHEACRRDVLADLFMNGD